MSVSLAAASSASLTVLSPKIAACNSGYIIFEKGIHSGISGGVNASSAIEALNVEKRLLMNAFPSASISLAISSQTLVIVGSLPPLASCICAS